MSEPSANFWVSQADSDWLCAQRVYDPNDHRTYCQVISKYQQTVEKSVKAIFACLKDKGINLGTLGYDHDLSKKLNALKRLPRPKQNREIQSLVNRLLDDYQVAEINLLGSFAPKKPAAAALHARNTEYPFETSKDVWTAPALLNSFAQNEVIRFQQLAARIFNGARQIVSIVSRTP